MSCFLKLTAEQMIPIRWLLTVDSKMSFFPFPFARRGCACFLLKLMRFKKKACRVSENKRFRIVRVLIFPVAALIIKDGAY